MMFKDGWQIGYFKHRAGDISRLFFDWKAGAKMRALKPKPAEAIAANIRTYIDEIATLVEEVEKRLFTKIAAEYLGLTKPDLTGFEKVARTDAGDSRYFLYFHGAIIGELRPEFTDNGNGFMLTFTPQAGEQIKISGTNV